MSNEDRSSSARTARLHCAPCRVIRSSGGGGGDPATWSQYPATQTVNLGCNDLNGVESVSFCDGTYMGPGGSFDISSNQNIDIISDQVRIGDAKGDRNNGTVVEVSNGGGSITLRAAVSDISSSTIEMGNGILKETRYDDVGVESSSITHGEDAEGKYIYMSVAGNEPTPVVVVKNTGIQPRQILDATNSSGGTGSYLTKDGVSNLTWIPIPPSVGGWYGIATSDLSMNQFDINNANSITVSSGSGNGVIRVEGSTSKGGQIVADEGAGNFIFEGTDGLATVVQGTSLVGISTSDVASAIGMTVGPAGASMDIIANGDDTGKISMIAQTSGVPAELTIDGSTTVGTITLTASELSINTQTAIGSGTPTNWIKVKINGADAWIPYLTSAPV